jgi:hypothetical protein
MGAYCVQNVNEVPVFPDNEWQWDNTWPPSAIELEPKTLYLDHMTASLTMGSPSTGYSLLIPDKDCPVRTWGGPNISPVTTVSWGTNMPCEGIPDDVFSGCSGAGKECQGQYDFCSPELSDRIGIGVADQSEIEMREDVLEFTSAPLPGPVQVTGEVLVHLVVGAIDMPETDWIVKLTEVYDSAPCGSGSEGSYLIAEAVEKRSHTVGEQHCVELRFNTSVVFSENHRIRISIALSNAPRLEVESLQCSELGWRAVIHGSYIELPVRTSEVDTSWHSGFFGS